MLSARRNEMFAQLHKTSNHVILTKAGIQYYQPLPGFRVKPGMTNRRVMQSSQPEEPNNQTDRMNPIPSALKNFLWLQYRHAGLDPASSIFRYFPDSGFHRNDG
jgi:hypothetical protein